MGTKRIIIGNWKMNPLTEKDAERLVAGIAKNIRALKKTDVVVCPPLLYISKLKKVMKKITLGAQDAFWGGTGAYTGEVSADMISLSGVQYVILGHSERRARGETSAEIRKKVKSALAAGLKPIVCVGEEVRDEKHSYFNEVKKQIEDCLNGISRNSIGKVILAYEPVWAISSTPDRRDATPEDSSEMAIFIRKILSDKFGKDATSTKIVYGGSVNDRDAEEFLSRGGVDGLLVGRASLDALKFAQIIRICETSST